MRISALVVVGAVGVAGWQLAAMPSDTVTVTTGARCRPGNDSTWLSMNPVRIQLEDNVRWAIEGGDADSLVVRPKQGQRWPFAGSPPGGRRGRPARTGAASMEGRYRYDIVLYCPAGESGLRPVVIDPDIIIGG